MKVSDHTLFFAFRYALHRRTAAPSIVIEDIKANWDSMMLSDKKQMKQEIKRGMDQAKLWGEVSREWNEVLELPI